MFGFLKLAHQKVSTQSTDISNKEFIRLNTMIIRKEVSGSKMTRTNTAVEYRHI